MVAGPGWCAQFFYRAEIFMFYFPLSLPPGAVRPPGRSRSGAAPRKRHSAQLDARQKAGDTPGASGLSDVGVSVTSPVCASELTVFAGWRAFVTLQPAVSAPL
jgi:hypothetical protein